MLKVRSSTADLVTAVLLLAAIVALYVHTFSFAPSPVRGYPGASFFPRLALVGTGIFTLLWIGLVLHARLGGRDLIETEGSFDFELQDYAISVVSVLLYVFSLGYVGFEIATLAFLTILLLPRIGIVAALVSAVLTTLVLYGIFVLLLNVSMPLLFLPRYVAF